MQVRVLGSFCLIDQKEVDWKVFVMEKNQAEHLKVKNLDDFQKSFPYKLEAILNWFINIKTFDGKSKNSIWGSKNADKGLVNIERTEEIIFEGKKAWEKLLSDQGYASKRKDFGI